MICGFYQLVPDKYRAYTEIESDEVAVHYAKLTATHHTRQRLACHFSQWAQAHIKIITPDSRSNSPFPTIKF